MEEENIAVTVLWLRPTNLWSNWALRVVLQWTFTPPLLHVPPLQFRVKVVLILIYAFNEVLTQPHLLYIDKHRCSNLGTIMIALPSLTGSQSQIGATPIM